MKKAKNNTVYIVDDLWFYQDFDGGTPLYNDLEELEEDIKKWMESEEIDGRVRVIELQETGELHYELVSVLRSTKELKAVYEGS